MARKATKNRLSPLENRVMNVIWNRGTATAEDVRIALQVEQPIKDSTVRTILRRLEEKGYVSHTIDGRTYVYAPMVAPRNVATEAVQGIIERFCDGSVEDLLVGMVDDEILTAETLKVLAARIAKAQAAEKRKK